MKNRLSAATWLWAAGFYVLLTLWVFRHTVAEIAAVVPNGADCMDFLWNTSWVHRALTELRSPYLTDLLYWPNETSLIYHTLGVSAIAPWTWLISLLEPIRGVVVAHNLVVLSSFVLCSLLIYLLAEQETRSRPAALAAGVLFGFSAYRLQMCGWSSLLSFQYVIAFTLLLLRAIRGSTAAAVGAGVCAALVAYNSLTHVLSGACLALAILSFRPLDARLIRAVAISAGVAVLLALPLVWEFYQSYVVREELWPAWGTQQASWGGLNPLQLLLPAVYPSAPAGWLEGALPESLARVEEIFRINLLAGVRPTFVRGSLGYFTLFWIIVGLCRRESRRAGRRWWVSGLVLLILSMGPYLNIGKTVYEGIPLPYWLLHELPGFSMSRTSYRLMAPALLCLSIFAALSMRDGLALVIERWRLRPPAALALWICVVLGVTVELTSHAPSVQRMQTSAFSRSLRADEGDYAIAYYPPAENFHRLEQLMWDQVTHQKRILLAAVSRIPVGHTDPEKIVLLRPGNRSAEQEADALGRVSQIPRYRIKYLVVGGRTGLERGKDTRLREILSERYPRVYQEFQGAPGQLRGFFHRDVFYVGGELFERELAGIRSAAEELATQPCTAEIAGLDARRSELRRAWNELRAGSAGWEREQQAFSEARALLDGLDDLDCASQ